MQLEPEENTPVNRRTLFVAGIIMFVLNVMFGVLFLRSLMSGGSRSSGDDGILQVGFFAVFLEALSIASLVLLVKYGRRTRQELPVDQQPEFARFISSMLVLFSILIAIPYALIFCFAVIMCMGSK